MYYKLINGQTIVGVVTSTNFRKYQPKHGLIIFANEENAQFVEYQDAYYRDNWLRSIEDGTIEYAEVRIVRINEDEYMDLIGQLHDGDLPIDDSLETEVVVEESQDGSEETYTVRKTAAQILEEQIKLAAIFAEV